MKRYRETWVVKNRPGNVSALMREFGISDVCARILWNRGYETKEAVADFLIFCDRITLLFIGNNCFVVIYNCFSA